MDEGENIEGDGRHPWPSYSRVVGVRGDAGRDREVDEWLEGQNRVLLHRRVYGLDQMGRFVVQPGNDYSDDVVCYGDRRSGAFRLYMGGKATRAGVGVGGSISSHESRDELEI